MKRISGAACQKITLHLIIRQNQPPSGWLDLGSATCSTSRRHFHFVQARCIDYLATPKGVFCLFPTDAIHHLVVLFLLSLIPCCTRFVQVNMFPVNVISSEPFDKLRINSVREMNPRQALLAWGYLDRRCAAPTE